MRRNAVILGFAMVSILVVSSLSQAALAQSRVQAGVSAAVKGRIEIAALGTTVGRSAKSGDDIFLGDQIPSGENAGMQVLLLDETVFTIGANSALTIDEFVYNPETGGGKVAAQVVRGAFRFVTGQIARRQPQAMAVRLPVGSIGIRGTIAAGRVDGNTSLVVLLGPGANTDTEERVGRILVSNAGETVEISRVGFATMIDGPGAVPMEPFQLPLADLRALSQSLDRGSAPKDGGGQKGGAVRRASAKSSGPPSQGAKAQGQGDQGGQGSQPGQKSGPQPPSQLGVNQATAQPAPFAGGQLNDATTQDLAGEGQVAADQNATNTLNTGDVRREGDGLLEDAVQDDPTTTLPTVTAGLASFDQIRRIKTGTHSFVIDTAFVQTQIVGKSTNLPGNMKFRLDIDFGARTLGGGESQLQVDTTAGGGNIKFNQSILISSYSKDLGFASKTFGQDVGDQPQIEGSTIEIRNADGVIAQTVRAAVKYDDGLGNRGTGAGDSANRVAK